MEKTMTEARADALMEDGFHCSQCVFPYAAFRLGMDRDEALRLSAGLGGGCFHGDSCGAVTGAAMALSIVFGFDRPNAEEADKLTEAYMARKRAGEDLPGFLAYSPLIIPCFGQHECNTFHHQAVRDVAPGFAARYCASACRILDSLIGDRYIR
mgnify:CR=1 FL=1